MVPARYARGYAHCGQPTRIPPDMLTSADTSVGVILDILQELLAANILILRSVQPGARKARRHDE